jgi:hypothetical protein
MWWCHKHKKLKYEHIETDEGPCPLWWVPVGWWDRLQCFLGDCEWKGTCIICSPTEQAKKDFEKWKGF